MEQFLSDAKRLVHRLHNHDSSADILISEVSTLHNKLVAMRQYREEVNNMNESANHRPRSTLILGSQLENQRIQALEHENRELSISLAEHQSALEVIMNKYREQVLLMMKANGTSNAITLPNEQSSKIDIAAQEKILEMAGVMRQATLLDDRNAIEEIELFRQLQVENEQLRELLEISGKKLPTSDTAKKLDKLYESFDIPKSLDSYLPNNINDSYMDNKDSGIYESQNYDGDSNSYGDSNIFEMPSRKKQRKPIYDSIENLFSKSDDSPLKTDNDNFHVLSPESNNFDDLSAEDETSQNCFRAIITDIKLLVESDDVSENYGTQIRKEISSRESFDTFPIRSEKHEVLDLNSEIKSYIRSYDGTKPIKSTFSEFTKLNDEDNHDNETNANRKIGNSSTIYDIFNINFNENNELKYETEADLTHLANGEVGNDSEIEIEENEEQAKLKADDSSISRENKDEIENIDESNSINGLVESDDESEATIISEVDDIMSDFDSILDMAEGDEDENGDNNED